MSIRQGNKVIAGHINYHPDLFDHKWADHLLNDVQWLRADTFSWQDGSVYEAAYQHLCNDIDGVATSITVINTGTALHETYNRYVDGDITDYYAWILNGVVIYTTSPFPSTSDVAYISLSPVKTFDIISITGLQSETIAGITIQFYLADDGHKICPASEESNVASIYSATGVAWYYIIDTVNERFKLPRTRFAFTGIRNGVGGFIEAGLPNITGTFRATLNTSYDADDTGVFSRGSNLGAQKTSLKDSYTYNNYKHTFDASNSSSVYGNSTTVQPQATEMYLYFYVGNFTQTAIENTAGLNAELFNEKADITAIPDLVEPIITPDYDNITTITNGTTYLADKTYLAILGSGSGSQAHVDISKNSDMSSPITIVQIYITSSGNIYFVSTGIIPKGWYYKATNGSTKIVPIG